MPTESWRAASAFGRDDVNVIGNTGHSRGFATQIAANRRQIRVYAGPNGCVEP
jgi:hypothetical protein